MSGMGLLNIAGDSLLKVAVAVNVPRKHSNEM